MVTLSYNMRNRHLPFSSDKVQVWIAQLFRSDKIQVATQYYLDFSFLFSLRENNEDHLYLISIAERINLRNESG